MRRLQQAQAEELLRSSSKSPSPKPATSSRQLLPRHLFMLKQVSLGLGIEPADRAEALFAHDSILAKVQPFLSSDGPSQLFFTYRAYAAPQAARRSHKTTAESTAGGVVQAWAPNTASSTAIEQPKVWRLEASFGDDLQTDGSPVAWFARTSSGAAVDCYNLDDSAVTFGVVAQPLQALAGLAAAVYKPLLTAQEPRLWGKAPPDQTHEFMLSLDSFVSQLQDSIAGLTGGLELRRPDEQYLAVAEAAAVAAAAVAPLATAGSSQQLQQQLQQQQNYSAEAVVHFSSLLTEWCDSVDKCLRDTTSTTAAAGATAGTTTAGSSTTINSSTGGGGCLGRELGYWRRRAQQLSSATEQLRSSACAGVLAALQQVSRRPEHVLTDRHAVSELVARWRVTEAALTAAALEASDSCKYLAALERFLQPLASGDLPLITELLPALLTALKTVHAVARHFGTPERMTRLFSKVRPQCAVLLTQCASML
jgi:Dynein heavy chain, N-terminal region 1